MYNVFSVHVYYSNYNDIYWSFVVQVILIKPLTGDTWCYYFVYSLRWTFSVRVCHMWERVCNWLASVGSVLFCWLQRDKRKIHVQDDWLSLYQWIILKQKVHIKRLCTGICWHGRSSPAAVNNRLVLWVVGPVPWHAYALLSLVLTWLLVLSTCGSLCKLWSPWSGWHKMAFQVTVKWVCQCGCYGLWHWPHRVSECMDWQALDWYIMGRSP